MMETHRFRNDTQTRKRLMVPDSFAHPAKGHLGLWQTMIERYSQPGDLVLDPMAGVGTTLVAALMGRNVICVELEPHFVDPMRRSWEKMRQMPMLGCEMGQVVILRGDAWCLPLPDASVGVAITSPLYEGSLVESDTYQRTAEKVRRGEYTGKRPDVCFAHPNIGAQGFSGGYTRPVDAIVTSPSYEGTNIGRNESLGEAPFGGPNSQARGVAYAPGHAENIGNLRSDAYWSAMRQVYAESWRVLRPGGLMALVLKGFTRDGQYVDLPGQTEALLLEAGWLKHDHWRRELWSLSFWRTLQKRRDPAAFDERLKFEEVLAFRKGDSLCSSQP